MGLGPGSVFLQQGRIHGISEYSGSTVAHLTRFTLASGGELMAWVLLCFSFKAKILTYEIFFCKLETSAFWLNCSVGTLYK